MLKTVGSPFSACAIADAGIVTNNPKKTRITNMRSLASTHNVEPAQRIDDRAIIFLHTNLRIDNLKELQF
jgi:hypothetical protein